MLRPQFSRLSLLNFSQKYFGRNFSILNPDGRISIAELPISNFTSARRKASNIHLSRNQFVGRVSQPGNIKIGMREYRFASRIGKGRAQYCGRKFKDTLQRGAKDSAGAIKLPVMILPPILVSRLFCSKLFCAAIKSRIRLS